METLIKENERVDDLQLKGLKIIQNPEGFCFGIDAVLVSNFSQIKKNGVVVDLGTGTGIIPLLVSGKSTARKIYGVEVQEAVAEMAHRSVMLNGLDERVEIIHRNLKTIFDVCTLKKALTFSNKTVKYEPKIMGFLPIEL